MATSPITLSELKELRDKLIRARASNVRELTDQNGEQIRYASDREMSAALASIEARIAAWEGPPAAFRFYPTKGV